MIEILFLLSFLLHIITFIFIRHLKNKQKDLIDIEEKMTTQVEQMENSLALYLVELREENERFTEELEKLQNHTIKETSTPKKVETNKRNTEDSYTMYNPMSNIKDSEKVESSLESKVLYLFEKGLTSEEIAKQLNKGTTEIELILKFRQKNN